jgi:hypothetical protein
MLHAQDREVKHAEIDSAGGETLEVVAAVTGKQILVLAWDLFTSAAAVLVWKSASTTLDGKGKSLAANTGFAASSLAGVLKTALSEALNLTITGTANIGGTVTYVEV